MPQPLSRVTSRAGIRIGNIGDYPLQRHPRLALLAMECIRSWSDVENFMLTLYLDLLGGPADNAAVAYLALESSSAKKAAIQAVADKVLTERHKPLLRALFKLINTHQKFRDKLAHHVWGDSPDIPDALLLVDPRAMIGELDRDQIFVYREADFANQLQANERLAGFGMIFRFIVTNHVANANGELFDKLCAEPEIAEILNREHQG